MGMCFDDENTDHNNMVFQQTEENVGRHQRSAMRHDGLPDFTKDLDIVVMIANGLRHQNKKLTCNNQQNHSTGLKSNFAR